MSSGESIVVMGNKLATEIENYISGEFFLAKFNVIIIEKLTLIFD